MYDVSWSGKGLLRTMGAKVLAESSQEAITKVKKKYHNRDSVILAEVNGQFSARKHVNKCQECGRKK